jgi:hypothetical protein
MPGTLKHVLHQHSVLRGGTGPAMQCTLDLAFKCMNMEMMLLHCCKALYRLMISKGRSFVDRLVLGRLGGRLQIGIARPVQLH